MEVPWRWLAILIWSAHHASLPGGWIDGPSTIDIWNANGPGPDRCSLPSAASKTNTPAPCHRENVRLELLSRRRSARGCTQAGESGELAWPGSNAIRLSEIR